MEGGSQGGGPRLANGSRHTGSHGCLGFSRARPGPRCRLWSEVWGTKLAPVSLPVRPPSLPPPACCSCACVSGRVCSCPGVCMAAPLPPRSGPPGPAWVPGSGQFWERQPGTDKPFLPFLHPRKQKQRVHAECGREQPAGPGPRAGAPEAPSRGQWQRVRPHGPQQGRGRRLVGASRQPAQPWEQPAQPGLHHGPRAPPVAPPDKGILGGGRAAWGAPRPGAGRCPPRADRQPPVLPEGHGEPLRVLRRHHVTEDRVPSSERPCGGGTGVLLPPRSLCGLALAVAVGSGSFPCAPGAVLWGLGWTEWGQADGLGGALPEPPYLASAAICPWSEQLCPCGPGGLCGMGLRDPRMPTALHTGPQAKLRGGCWAWSLWSPSVQALRLLLRLGGPCWGWTGAPQTSLAAWVGV